MRIYSHEFLIREHCANKFAPTMGSVSQTEPKNEDSNMDSILKKGGKYQNRFKESPQPPKEG